MQKLPEDPNKKHILANCMTCHASSYIEEHRLSRKAWDKTIAWMEAKHNLKLNSPEIREKILDYLEKYFSPANDEEKPFIAQRQANLLQE